MAKWIIVFCFFGFVTRSLAGYNYPAPIPIPIGGNNIVINGPVGPGNVYAEGYQNREGYSVIEPELINAVKDTVLRDEIERQAIRGSISPVYGVPNRIVGIELGPIRPGIEVNQLHQRTLVRGPEIISNDVGYPIGNPNGYATIGIPSRSYGVPVPPIAIPQPYPQPINHY